jgi:hypothetical protein
LRTSFTALLSFATIAGGTPAEAAAFIKKETEVWGGVIKDARVEAH